MTHPRLTPDPARTGLNEAAQIDNRRVQVGAGGEFFVVDRENEGAGAALLLRELRQIAVTGHAQHLEALGLKPWKGGAEVAK